MKQAKDKGIPINKANVETYARRGGEIIDWLEQLGVPSAVSRKTSTSTSLKMEALPDLTS